MIKSLSVCRRSFTFCTSAFQQFFFSFEILLLFRLKMKLRFCPDIILVLCILFSLLEDRFPVCLYYFHLKRSFFSLCRMKILCLGLFLSTYLFPVFPFALLSFFRGHPRPFVFCISAFGLPAQSADVWTDVAPTLDHLHCQALGFMTYIIIAGFPCCGCQHFILFLVC